LLISAGYIEPTFNNINILLIIKKVYLLLLFTGYIEPTFYNINILLIIFILVLFFFIHFYLH